MPNSNNTLCLDKFYPEKDLKITDIVQQKDNILIRMKSISKSCKCPKCNYFTDKYHGAYNRKVQDLPIFGKIRPIWEKTLDSARNFLYNKARK